MPLIECHDEVAGQGVRQLFVDMRGQPFTPSWFSQYYGNMLHQVAGIEEHVVPRGLRHIFATAACEGGIPEEGQWDVATLMGHHHQMWAG